MKVAREESIRNDYNIINNSNNITSWTVSWNKGTDQSIRHPWTKKWTTVTKDVPLVAARSDFSDNDDIEATYISLLNEEKNQQTIQYKLLYPFVTFPMFLLNWVSFFIGVFFIIKWENANLSLTGPISPPNDFLYFYSVYNFPNCADLRFQVWRTVLYQFAHMGISHLGGNTLIGVLYGSLFEIYHPCGHLAVLILYEMSIIFGALGHALIWPYRGMIGCSPGVYGLFGACFSLIIFNKIRINNGLVYYSILGMLITQLTVDIISYHFFYLDGVSSAGHAFGFYTGFCVGLAFGLFYVKEKWKKGIAVVGCCGLIIEIFYLYYHFYTNWPPVAYEQPFLHNTGSQGCCNQLLSYIGEYDKNELETLTYCSNGNMYFH